MVIISDDAELKKSADLIIPLNIVRYENEDAEIYVYPDFEEIGHIVDSFDDPLSDEALAYIREELAEDIDRLGYYYDPEVSDSNGVIMSADEPNLSVIRSDTIKLDDPFEYENISGEEYSFDGAAVFATVIDGKVVSFASENEATDNVFAEIFVATSPEYRNRGYAASNIAALSVYLFEQGKTPLYTCGNENVSSVRAAEKAGYIVSGRFYYHVCYKKEI